MQVLPALIIWIVLVVSIGLTLRQPLREIHRLRRAARVPIGLLPPTGVVEVSGQASGTDLRSPLTDTPCIFWQVEVEAYRSSGRHGTWITIFDRASSAPVTIDDGTAQVQILPGQAESYI
jgi:hypothetical protein